MANTYSLGKWAGLLLTLPCWPNSHRTMVKWLFTRPSAQGQLRAMNANIDAALQKRAATSKAKGESEEDEGGLGRVRVGVTCCDGTQLSPCFVEKLFHHYDTSTHWDKLTVRRFHWDAMIGAWGHNKDFVWQQRTVPTQRLESIRDVAIDEVWTVFPSSVNAAIEAAFSQNPYCHKFQYEHYSFDFESGLVYNRRHRNSYLLRCNVSLSNSKVNCWFLGHVGYMACSDGYKAAGILPYSVHPRSGEAILLLGKITYGSGNWCDFGGLKSFR